MTQNNALKDILTGDARPLTVMVTGASGFIASHVVDRLLEDGNEVIALDLWQSAAIEAQLQNPRLRFVCANILQDEIVGGLFHGVDVLIHAAAILGTGETITKIDVEQTALTNVVGTVKMLQYAVVGGVRRVIVPTTPDVAWLNPYKITKNAVHQFCRLYHCEFGLETVSLQLGNVYGARERWVGDVASAPFNYQKIIPTMLMNALRGEVFTIYGDGRQKSEYIYVDDVVEAFARAVTSQCDLGGETIPVGCGCGISVNQVVDAVQKVWRRKIKTVCAPMRVGETFAEICLSPEPLRRHLDYALRYSLEQGLARTIPYYEELHRMHGAKV